MGCTKRSIKMNPLRGQGWIACRYWRRRSHQRCLSGRNRLWRSFLHLNVRWMVLLWGVTSKLHRIFDSRWAHNLVPATQIRRDWKIRHRLHLCTLKHRVMYWDMDRCLTMSTGTAALSDKNVISQIRAVAIVLTFWFCRWTIVVGMNSARIDTRVASGVCAGWSWFDQTVFWVCVWGRRNNLSNHIL